jgi:peptide deformylase
MLELVPENSEILSRICEPFDFANPFVDHEKLIGEMRETMRELRGVGLAAPQIGVSGRFFVMGDEGFALECINPQIIERSPDILTTEEGCLSFPNLRLKIGRAQWLVARFQTINGTFVEQRFFNLLARCYAHELDHLNGITFDKKVGPLALNMARSRRRKMMLKGH